MDEHIHTLFSYKSFTRSLHYLNQRALQCKKGVEIIGAISLIRLSLFMCDNCCIAKGTITVWGERQKLNRVPGLVS